MMKDNVYTIFYSWQSDKPEVKKAIFRELQNVKESLAIEGIELIVEQDTGGRVGTKNIEDEVLRKIRNCDIFLADVTPICKIDTDGDNHKVAKLIPNPNVMYESGYALSQKGLERMILVAALEDGESQSALPFDINHNTITNIRDTRTLSSLTSWVRTIINAVSEDRNTQKKEYECQVFFSENGHSYESVTIQPHYRKILYVREATSQSNSVLPQKPQMGMSAIELFTKYANHISKSGNLVPPKNVVGVKPYSVVINHAACPIRLTVGNIGEKELNNLFLFADIETPGVTFTTNNEENVVIPKLDKTDYVIINNNRLQYNIGLINPNMMISTNKVFVIVPPGVESVAISWSVQATRHRQEGKLVINVKPEYKFESQADNAKAGTTEIVLYKEYK